MITEDYVSFEIAKLLKEKGFKGQGEHFYEDNKITNYINYWFRITPEQRYEAIEAPTIQMAMKWLRKEHNLHCDIGYDDLDWFWNIISVSEDIPPEERPKLIKDGYAANKTYEEACEEAIKYCLENLI
jgi:hypothetical protein